MEHSGDWGYVSLPAGSAAQALIRSAAAAARSVLGKFCCALCVHCCAGLKATIEHSA